MMMIKNSGSAESKFPGDLHDMMSYIEDNGLEHIASWVLDGRGFMIHDPAKLEKIMPLFFKHEKYRSFRRQVRSFCC